MTVKKIGFASLSPEQRKWVAGNGGIQAHKNGTAHKWNSETAAVAGHKGGKTPKRPRQLSSKRR